MPKLVRDNYPAIAKKKGETMNCHVATPPEYKELLRKKLSEEVKEFLESEEPIELADILEVVRSIAREKGLTFQSILDLRDKKRKEKGGFDKRLVWDEQ